MACGAVRVARRVPLRPELVPSPRAFFGSDAAHAALAALLRAEAAGERALLLMGNQGVGKNVCVDQLLHMLRCEREYVQPGKHRVAAGPRRASPPVRARLGGGVAWRLHGG